MSSSRLRLPKTQLFRFQYTSKYPTTPNWGPVDEPATLLKIRRQLFDDHLRTGLQYSCRAGLKVARKRLPRSHACRRIVFAFRDALKTCKLTEKGQIGDPAALSADERAFELKSIGDAPAPIDLSGHVIFIPTQALLTAKHEEIREETGKVVRYLMRLHWIEKNGKSLTLESKESETSGVHCQSLPKNA